MSSIKNEGCVAILAQFYIPKRAQHYGSCAREPRMASDGTGNADGFEHPRATKVIVAAQGKKGNPIIASVRSTSVEFVEGLVSDYLVGPSAAILFISLKCHRLHPDYLERRIGQLTEGGYRSRINSSALGGRTDG